MSETVWELTPEMWQQKRWGENPPAVLLGWTRDHGIDPMMVSLNYPVTVEADGERRFIRYREPVLDADGNSQISDDGDGIITVERRVGLLLDPPDLSTL